MGKVGSDAKDVLALAVSASPAFVDDERELVSPAGDQTHARASCSIQMGDGPANAARCADD